MMLDVSGNGYLNVETYRGYHAKYILCWFIRGNYSFSPFLWKFENNFRYEKKKLFRVTIIVIPYSYSIEKVKSKELSGGIFGKKNNLILATCENIVASNYPSFKVISLM